MFPGSVHEGGEPIEWERDGRGEPAEVDGTHLERAPCKGAISQWEIDPPGNFRSGR